MLKKTVVLIAVLVLMAMPCVLADETEAVDNPSQYIDIEYIFDSKEAEINGEYSFGIKVSNLTTREITIDQIDCGNFSGQIDGFYINDNLKRNSLILRPLQSVEALVKMTVSENVKWYKNDDGFFANIQPSLMYYFNEVKEIEYYNYIMDKPEQIELTNLQDGNEFFEINWLDERDTFYYTYSYTEEDANGEEITYYGGFTYYQISLKNISEEDIKRYKKDEELIRRGYFYNVKDASDETQKLEFEYKLFFNIDDEYYTISKYREYAEGYINMPAVNLQSKFVSDDKGAKTYEITINNAGESPIDNFLVVTWEDMIFEENSSYMKTGTLNVDEKWVMECIINDEYEDSKVGVGYLVDGIMYLWYPDWEFPKGTSQTADTGEFLYPQPRSFDYDYRVKYPKNTNDEDTDIDETTSTPEVETTPSPTAEVEEEERESVFTAKPGSYVLLYVAMFAGIAFWIGVLAWLVIFNKNEEE